jgi:hypothetical protein
MGMDALAHGEFPDGRHVMAPPELVNRLRRLIAPDAENPDPPAMEQVIQRFRAFALGLPIAASTVTLSNRRAGIWEWRLRTSRLAGIYVAGPHSFVALEVVLRRDLNRTDGRMCPVQRKIFSQRCEQVLRELGLEDAVWRGIPHNGTT